MLILICLGTRLLRTSDCDSTSKRMVAFAARTVMFSIVPMDFVSIAYAL
jgi:hypothetical protein